MQLTGNTILVTGGGSGIGRALAEAFHDHGNTVIIAGRRQEQLDETTAANPRMKSAVLDIGDKRSIESFATDFTQRYPALNMIIHSAGIMRLEYLTDSKLDDAEATVATNLLGPIRLNAALLPLLQLQARASIMTVSSGLAFLPKAMAPTYCATKAAIHSYTQSLRYQLKDTHVQVIELIPPYVQTELMGAQQARDPLAMPLKKFIAEVLAILEEKPDAMEICVDRVKPLRFAESSGNYEGLFRNFNDAQSAASTGQ